MDAAGLILVAVLFSAACAAVAIGGLAHEIFRPAAVERRHRNRVERDAYRAARRPHTHDWERWSEVDETRVFENNTSKDDAKNRLPIRRDLRQTRECRDCGLVERRLV